MLRPDGPATLLRRPDLTCPGRALRWRPPDAKAACGLFVSGSMQICSQAQGRSGQKLRFGSATHSFECKPMPPDRWQGTPLFAESVPLSALSALSRQQGPSPRNTRYLTAPSCIRYHGDALLERTIGRSRCAQSLLSASGNPNPHHARSGQTGPKLIPRDEGSIQEDILAYE